MAAAPTLEDGAMPTPEEEAAAKAAEEAAAKAAKDKADAEAAAAKKAEEDAAKLGDAGKAALDAERKARKDADKALKEAQAKLDAIETANLSETDKLKKEAEDGKRLAGEATEKLRKAHLIAALSEQEHGIVSPAAAAKLIEGVEFGDDDQPTNLTALLPTFLEANSFLKGTPGKPVPPDTNNGGGGGGKAPELTADELAVAQRNGMKPDEYAAFKPRLDASGRPVPVTLADLEEAGVTKKD